MFGGVGRKHEGRAGYPGDRLAPTVHILGPVLGTQAVTDARKTLADSLIPSEGAS